MLVVLKNEDTAVAVDHTQIKRILKIRGISIFNEPSVKIKAYYLDDSNKLTHRNITNDNYLELTAILTKLAIKEPDVYFDTKGRVYIDTVSYDWDKEQDSIDTNAHEISSDIDISVIKNAIPQLIGKEYQVQKHYSDKMQKDVVEVDTPFTDAVSDGIGVYILKEDNNTYKITDDGWTYYELSTYHNVTTKKLAENQLVDIPDNEDIKLYNDGDEIAATCDKDGLQEAFNLVLTTIIKISVQALEQSKKLD